jgi:para-nitrobenzyl esterase
MTQLCSVENAHDNSASGQHAQQPRAGTAHIPGISLGERGTPSISLQGDRRWRCSSASSTHRMFFLSLWFIASLAACRGDETSHAADSGGDRDASALDSASTIVDGVDVPTDKGTLHGTTSGSVRSFLGIPFAAPPTGDKRWQPPQPVDAWRETRDATNAGAMCPQPDMLSGVFAGDEDCLFVNVWTPDPAPAKPLPVMVWFHGGAFTFGSGSDAIYDGSHLVERGQVVIVTTNYRLGALGYLAHPAISQAADPRASGNYGLMDQRAALQWVKTNIAAFGGDATNVTIFGESAGARSVCTHLVSGPSRGLFKRAIAESGICAMPTYTLADAEAQGQRFAKQLGCTDLDTALDCLQHQSAADLVAAAAAPATMPGGTFFQDRQRAFVFGPTIDGVNLDAQMLDSMARRASVQVPLLHGANTDEGIVFTASVLGSVKEVSNAAEYETALSARFRHDDVARILVEYPVDAYENPNAALTDAAADAFLVCAERKIARLLAGVSIDTYLYSFGTPLTGTPIPILAGKAFHTSELPFVFGNSYALGSVSPDAQPIADQIQDYWLRFARTGDPNGTDAPVWPTYSEPDDQLMSFRDTSTVSAGLKKEHCDFWDSIEPLELP